MLWRAANQPVTPVRGMRHPLPSSIGDIEIGQELRVASHACPLPTLVAALRSLRPTTKPKPTHRHLRAIEFPALSVDQPQDMASGGGTPQVRLVRHRSALIVH
jgi:hypothetical protein